MSSLDETEQKIQSLDLDDDVVTRKITLLPKDENDESKGFTVDCAYTKISGLVDTMVEGDKEATIIPLNVDRTTLSYVVEWFNYKKGNQGVIVPRPLGRGMRESCVDKWDAEFIDRVAKKKEDLFHLFESADYLEMNTLLHLAGACIALSLKGKNKDEMKKILTIEKKNNQE